MGLMDQMKDAAKQAQDAAQKAGAQAQEAAQKAGVGGATPTADDAAFRDKVMRLNESGVEQPATIKRIEPTGKTDAGGAGKEYEVEVEVKPADGDPYPATFTQSMHEQTMGSWATEGADVNVKVDPDDKSSMILWGGTA